MSIRHMFRHGSAVFWSYLGVTTYIGIPRLVLFPVAAHCVGKEDFGLFTTLLSFTLIIGAHPSNGLATGLLRDLANYDASARAQLTATAVRLCHKALAFILMGAAIVLTGIFMLGVIDLKVYLVMCLLSVSLYGSNQYTLMLTPLRYKRLFREHALWSVASSMAVLLFGVIGAYVGGIVGLAFGMMAGYSVVYVLVANRYHETGAEYKKEHAKVLQATWLHMTIAGMLVVVGPHLNRIVLRMYWDNESVADLFAVSSIAYVFIMPISQVSGLLMSMISRYRTMAQISARAYKTLLGMLVAGATAATVLFYFAAPVAMRLLYPSFGEEAMDLFDILIWMIPLQIIIAFVRPFSTKFAPVTWMPRINVAVLITTFILMFSLIPHWGLVGAAWSILGGSIAASVVRIGVVLVIAKRSVLAQGKDSDLIDQEAC